MFAVDIVRESAQYEICGLTLRLSLRCTLSYIWKYVFFFCTGNLCTKICLFCFFFAIWMLLLFITVFSFYVFLYYGKYFIKYVVHAKSSLPNLELFIFIANLNKKETIWNLSICAQSLAKYFQKRISNMKYKILFQKFFFYNISFQ